MSERPDETIPGGRYFSPDETRFVDANGKDLGPVNADPDHSEANPFAKQTKQQISDQMISAGYEFTDKRADQMTKAELIEAFSQFRAEQDTADAEEGDAEAEPDAADAEQKDA
jgi:hypothetical protein